MTDEPHYKVFISHSSSDREWTSKFASSLKGLGISAWSDVSSLSPGERWQDRIQQALRESKVFVVIVSSPQVDAWTSFELGAALADNKVIIPVLTGDISLEQLSPLLRQFQFLNEESPDEAGKAVASVIEKLQSAGT